MRPITRTARILRYAAIGGFQDFFALYTWSTWTFGWLLRVIAQVVFFTMVGRLIGDEQQMHFLLVGNAVFLSAMTVMFIVQSTTWERSGGTIPLLIASPSHPLIVLLGRSVQWIPDALASSLAALLVVGPLFGLPMPWPSVLWVVPLLLLITLATYCMGALIGSVVLRYMESRNLVANIVHGGLMAIAGVNIPVDSMPGWIQAVAKGLPLTHGLLAIRAVLGQAPQVNALREAAFEALVGGCWLLVAAASFGWFLEGGRRDGSIEFST